MNRAVLVALALSLLAPTFGGGNVRGVATALVARETVRPIPAWYGSSCGMTDNLGRVLSADGRELGKSQMIYLGGEDTVATSEIKGAHAKPNSGDDLVYQRSYTTNSPPSCPGTPPCNTLMSDLATLATCYNASKVDGIRGFNRGDNLATQAALFNGYAVTWRGATVPPPVILLSMRWDLLFPSEMQVAGFQPSFLLEAAPGAYDAFQSWLTSDTSYYCAASPAGCSWTDSYNGVSTGYRDKDLGFRFKDQIDYFGSPGDYKKYIYYLTRPTTAKPLAADGVLTDMSDDAYIAWRIARVKALIAEINQPNVVVLLNNKLGQRYSGPNGARNGSGDYSATGRCPNVTDLLWSSSGGGIQGESPVFAATPDYTALPHQSACHLMYTQGGAGGDVEGRAQSSGGYTSDTYAAGETYEEYVLSLKNVADELNAAGVPYAWQTGGGEFTGPPGYWNNNATATDEDAVLREITLGAAFVWLTGSSKESMDAGEAALKAGHGAYVRTRAGSPFDITLPPTLSACDDGVDNDLDSLVDYPADPGCESADDPSERGTTACDDGISNDTDGLVDYPADPGCSSPSDTSEWGTRECDDGINNDPSYDAQTDYPADSGCGSPWDVSEFLNYVCSDGLDNDSDGQIDYEYDAGCYSATDGSE